MVKYVKANAGADKDIVVTYRNKVIYDGTITAEPTDIFKGIKNFNPENNPEDWSLVWHFEHSKDTLSDYTYSECSYRNGLVKFYAKENFNPANIIPKERPDLNTAVIDGERYTAEEVADEVMLEADNYESVYNNYQGLLSDYAKKVVENGWEGHPLRDKVPFSAIRYVINNYKSQHTTRKNLSSICSELIAEYMQDDYDRYKSEFRGN